MLYDYNMLSTMQRGHKRQNASGLAPIHLRITISGQRADLSTGIFCPAAYWPKGTKQLVFPADKSSQVLPQYSAAAVTQLNDELARFKADVGEVYARLRRPDPRGPIVPVTVEQVKYAVRPSKAPAPEPDKPAPIRTLLEAAAEFLATMNATPEADRLAPATLKSYERRRNGLRRYLEIKNLTHTTVAQVDKPWARLYERWLLTPAGGHAAASMRKQVNFLQMTLSFATHEGWAGAKDLGVYKYQTKAAPPKALSLPAAEVAHLRDALPEMGLPARRAVVGWLFCCYTGLSWVDYRRFCWQPADFLFTEPSAQPGHAPRYWLRMVRQKMKRRKPQGFSVPLFDPAADLLIAWKGCLPHTHGVNTNKLLHAVEQELGLSVPLTTKLARATFSQMRRDEGYSDEAVAAMMGDTVSVMNKHYSKVSERRIALEMERIDGGSPMHIAA